MDQLDETKPKEENEDEETSFDLMETTSFDRSETIENELTQRQSLNKKKKKNLARTVVSFHRQNSFDKSLQNSDSSELDITSFSTTDLSLGELELNSNKSNRIETPFDRDEEEEEEEEEEVFFCFSNDFSFGTRTKRIRITSNSNSSRK